MVNYCQECGKKAGKKVVICVIRKTCETCLSNKGATVSPIQIDPGKNLSDLSVNDLISIVDSKMAEFNKTLTDFEQRLTTKFDKMKAELKEEISKEIEKETKAINEEMKSMKDTQEVMKKTSLEQQQYLEKLRRENSSCNVIITGIPKTILINDAQTEDATAKMQHIVTLVDNTITSDDYKVLKIFELKQYAGGSEKQSIKIRFTDINKKQSFMKKKMVLKSLQNDHPLKKVYINNDDPPLTHKENVRLRSKAYELRQKGEGTILLQKGVLTKDGVQVDRFDLSNQLF